MKAELLNFFGVEYFGKSKDEILISHLENRKKLNSLYES